MLPCVPWDITQAAALTDVIGDIDLWITSYYETGRAWEEWRQRMQEVRQEFDQWERENNH